MPEAAFRSVVNAQESLIKVWPSAFGLTRNVSPKTQTEFPPNMPLYPPSRPKIFGLFPIVPRSVVCATARLGAGPGEPHPDMARLPSNPTQTLNTRRNTRMTPPADA